MTSIFLYGTLRHLPLLDLVGGAALANNLVPAQLNDHQVYWAAGQSFPMIVSAPGETANGLLLTTDNQSVIDRLAFYENIFGYPLVPVDVVVDGARIPASVYWPENAGVTQGAVWDLDEWVRRWAEIGMSTAREVMDFYGKTAPHVLAPRMNAIRARAQSALTAQAHPPTTLRHRAGPGDVTLDSIGRPYADFFALEDLVVRHTRFDGADSGPLERAIFVAPDAATVLPYDPVTDQVLLIEQFRVGAFGRGDPQPWSLEAIAGRIDPGETASEAAIREAQEEAGLTLSDLVPVGGYYCSPGAKTEFLHSFIGLTDLSDVKSGIGGLAAENEDIRSHIISFDALMALVESGEAGNSPLLISALQLARRRADFQANASG